MQARALLPDARTLQCDGVEWNGQKLVVFVSSVTACASCPHCGSCSGRIHSRYLRRFADLPWHGIEVDMRWRTRRFFCDNSSCVRRIFTERRPEVAAPNGRRTSRLTVALRAIAMACGGEEGARLAERLGMPTSPDTMLREIRRNPVPSAAPVRVLGVDDWAMRRGHRYGTILVDLETHQPIDLLPERSSESFRDWLKCHPSVETISRDRGDYYIKGAAEGSPHAVQVADRWHLLHNLQEALVRLVDCFPEALPRAVRESKDAPSSPELASKQASPPCELGSTEIENTPRAERLRQERRGRRFKRYQQVLELHRQKVPLRAIARRLELHRSTVRKWVRGGSFPERVSCYRPSRLDKWLAYLQQRWEEGCHNAAELMVELRARGFDGSYNMVRRRVAHWRKRDGPLVPIQLRPKPSVRLSSKAMAWLLFKSTQERNSQQQQLVQTFCEACPQAKEAANLAAQFHDLIRQQCPDGLDSWLTQATAAGAPAELQRFAAGLKDDLAAVRAALSLAWSNGQTEGQVNRLKLIKRKMYGRANFDLLRQRVLATS